MGQGSGQKEASGIMKSPMITGLSVNDHGTGNDITIDDNVIATRASLTINGRNNSITIGHEVNLTRATIIVRGSNCHISIGRSCRFKQGTLFLADNGTEFHCGEETTWESGQIIAQHGGKIHLGKHCMLSHDVMIRTSDSHGIFDMTSRQLLNPAKDVVVGNRVWIGNGARLNKGVTIGNDSVVAQLSVVSGTVGANTLVAGIPAKVLRTGIIWSRTMAWPERASEMQSSSEPMDATDLTSALNELSSDPV